MSYNITSETARTSDIPQHTEPRRKEYKWGRGEERRGGNTGEEQERRERGGVVTYPVCPV